MTTNTGPHEYYAGFHPAILCPCCGKGAVAVEHNGETGVAW